MCRTIIISTKYCVEQTMCLTNNVLSKHCVIQALYKPNVCWLNVCWPNVCWPNICLPNVCWPNAVQFSTKKSGAELSHSSDWRLSLLAVTRIANLRFIYLADKKVSFLKSHLTGTVHNRHQCKKTTVLSCQRCIINTGVEKMNNI